MVSQGQLDCQGPQALASGMGKVSWNPGVQFFVSLFEVGREEVGAVTRPVGDVGEPPVCPGRIQSRSLVGGLSDRQPVSGPLPSRVIVWSFGAYSRKKKMVFPLLWSCCTKIR